MAHNNQISKTYKSCDAKYAAKKLSKACRKGEISNPRIANYLEIIKVFAEENRMRNLLDWIRKAEIAMECESNPINGDLGIVLKNVSLQIEHLDEKRRIMEARENISRVKFFNNNSKTNPCTKSEALKKYDVVKVPTQGGLHYSIVAEVNEDFVTCYPTTSANRHQLERVGCKSLSLSPSGDESFNGIRLTSSAVKIPIESARKSYTGSVANNVFICNALARIMAKA